ncbi:HAAS signaling domain-containing protein [Kangiella sp.]|uniref:HAAS signaling domain-containing protein n=1 Tax=Kangiella sp. TaxID=1920245 RepID=UPI003A8D0536
MSNNDSIKKYLNQLRKYLSRLEKEEADEVIREIEAHIFDVIEAREQAGEAPNIQEIFNGFGEPKELASKYISHIMVGTPPPEGFRPIQIVKRGVSKTLYYSMLVFGYGISFALIAFALVNLFLPYTLGVWSSASGESIVIGWLHQADLSNGAKVFSGLWLSPVAIVLAAIEFFITHRVLRVLKRHLN